MTVRIHGCSVDVDAIYRALASAAPPTIFASSVLAPELEATATIYGRSVIDRRQKSADGDPNGGGDQGHGPDARDGPAEEPAKPA